MAAQCVHGTGSAEQNQSVSVIESRSTIQVLCFTQCSLMSVLFVIRRFVFIIERGEDVTDQHPTRSVTPWEFRTDEHVVAPRNREILQCLFLLAVNLGSVVIHWTYSELAPRTEHFLASPAHGSANDTTVPSMGLASLDPLGGLVAVPARLLRIVHLSVGNNSKSDHRPLLQFTVQFTY
jgi:hypothetical protein